MAASGAESDQTQVDILNGLLALWTSEALALSIQLFSTDVAVTNASALGDFTLAPWAGGAALGMTAADFAAAAIAAHVASSTGPLKTWINGGGAATNVWGYVVFETVSQDFRWGENFGAAQAIAAGGAFTVQPILKQRTTYF